MSQSFVISGTPCSTINGRSAYRTYVIELVVEHIYIWNGCVVSGPTPENIISWSYDDRSICDTYFSTFYPLAAIVTHSAHIYQQFWRPTTTAKRLNNIPHDRSHINRETQLVVNYFLAWETGVLSCRRSSLGHTPNSCRCRRDATFHCSRLDFIVAHVICDRARSKWTRDFQHLDTRLNQTAKWEFFR